MRKVCVCVYMYMCVYVYACDMYIHVICKAYVMCKAAMHMLENVDDPLTMPDDTLQEGT